MMPLLTFVAGLAAGAAAVSALRSERAKSALNETGSRLRSAAATVESSVRAAAESGLAAFKRKPAAEPEAPAEPATSAKKAKRPARRPAAAKAAATKTAATPKRAPRKPKTAPQA